MTTAPAKPAAERVRDVTGDQPVESGARLIRALKASGTPDAKLQPARNALRQAGKDLPAAAVIEALENDGVSEATVRKAKALAATGQLPVREAARPIEDVLLDPPKADEPSKPAGWKAAPKK
jgi:hypothetical protein